MSRGKKRKFSDDDDVVAQGVSSSDDDLPAPFTPSRKCEPGVSSSDDDLPPAFMPTPSGLVEDITVGKGKRRRCGAGTSLAVTSYVDDDNNDVQCVFNKFMVDRK